MKAGAARSCFDFRSGAENFFDVKKDSVGFGKGTSGRREVIEYEAALVHFGQEVGFEESVSDERKNNDENAATDEENRTFYNGLHGAGVQIHSPGEEPSEVLILGGEDVLGL